MALTGLPRIVIVDDRDEMRELLRTLLEYDERFDVVGEAADGLEAIEVAGTMLPDVILLDHQMPHLSGMDAIARIRARAPLVKIMMLSSDPMIGREALARGADAFRDKATPFEVIAAGLAELVGAGSSPQR